MLELNKINKKFKVFSINEISISFEKGNIYYMLGKNGSGKTTLFKLILGLLKYDSGEINYESSKKDFLNGCSIMADLPKFQEDYNGFINIELIVKKYDKKILKDLCKYYGFDYDLLSTDVRYYSLGQRRLLSIFIIILEDNQVLILDEPTIGLDYYTWNKFSKYLIENKSDKLIIISGHNYEQLFEISDVIIYIDNGKIIECSKSNDFIGRYNNINKKIKYLFIK